MKPNAKGKGAKSTGTPATQIDVTPAAVSAAPSGPRTPYDIFTLCIARAENLLNIEHGTGPSAASTRADADRAAIVLAISALDAFVRAFVIARINAILTQRIEVSKPLMKKLQECLTYEELFAAYRDQDLPSRVEQRLWVDFEARSTQGSGRITEYMAMVGIENVFKQVAKKADANEDRLRAELERFTNRRHEIAHRGDYDLSVNPPKEKPIHQDDAHECIRVVTLIAKQIHSLERA